VVFRYDLERVWPASDAVSGAALAAVEGLERRGRFEGQPFLIGPSGLPDLWVNGFFSSRRVRRMSPLTLKKYAHSLGLWLNFLTMLGREWHAATEEDAESFKEWRITEAANPDPVRPTTFRGDLAALRSFYRWAAGVYGVADPVAALDGYDLMPRGPRLMDIKWLDPAGYRRWRDLGLRGLDTEGRPAGGWRGRSEQRDCAFVDGLYGTGLRLTEWASLLLGELPADDPARGYATCWLADACAKGGDGHKYWMPRWALVGVLDYVEGARARAVRRAQADGRYERLRVLRLVLGPDGDRLRIAEPDGRETRPPVNALAPAARRRLFCRGRQGLEPLAVWLNEDGMPRVPHGWQHTFDAANARVAGLGFPGLLATAHHLRHSFALRWYSVGRLAYEQRFAHLSEDEQKDFRAQFGNTWDLVATMLGHRSPETTKNHYLEPFRSLDVELLLRHAGEASVTEFLAGYLADHPRVRTDPLRRVR
jgi:integrase